MSTWEDRALCAEPSIDPEWFFPVAPGLAGNKAKAICNRCPVRPECLDAALNQPVSGIWGGTSESQRVIMRREQGIGLPSGWAARKELSRWEERYYEMKDLGLTDFDIMRRLRVKPESLVRQLSRFGITPSPELISLAAQRKGEQAS